MQNIYFVLINLIILRFSENRLISVFGLINQHNYIQPKLNSQNDTLSNEINSILETDTKGMSLHIEMGNILRMKYLENNNILNKEYANFSMVNNFYRKVQIYSSNSPEALQSAIGEAMGLFPDVPHKTIKIDEKGSMNSEDKNSNITRIKYFAKKLDIVHNSEKCLKLTEIKILPPTPQDNSTNIPNLTSLFPDEEFQKIILLKNVFNDNFKNYCIKIKNENCNNETLIDNNLYKDLEFVNDLYELIKLMKDFNVNVKVRSNRLKNNYKNFEFHDEILNILLKYHLLYLYTYNSDEINQKQISTPLFRFVNGYLENTKSKQCSKNINEEKKFLNNTKIDEKIENLQIISNITENLESPQFIQLNNFKPVDILRQMINESKCKKILLMISNNKNLVNFLKVLFHYDEVMNLLRENKIKMDASNMKLLRLFDPQPANSLIFQVHQYENDEKLYVRIFYNLDEISNLNVKLKINYENEKGISMDDLVSHLNTNSDSHLKYKDQCD